MPVFQRPPAAFKPRKDLQANWDGFRKGLNLLLRPTELGRDELAQADNILLTGSGIPKGRWGTSTYFTANATGSIRGFGTFKDTDQNEIIALSDQGYLAKKNGSSSTVITGQSYASGSIVRSEQLGGKTYFVSEDKALTVYDGSTLSVFITLSAPTGLTATNFSGATGTTTWSWRVTTLSSTGETTGSTAVELPALPQNLSDTEIRVNWTLATGPVTGYQIYRGIPADETLLASVGPSISSYVDRGETASQITQPPLTNTTGGVESPYIAKFIDRLIMVDGNDKTKLLVSGRYPYQDRFSAAYGGGYIYIDPGSGQDITGIAVQPGTNKIIVYKEFSHYEVQLTTVQLGNFLILDPTYQPISTSIGASGQDSIVTVENDTFYFGRKGLYVTGFEPNFLNVIRTNEISARVRPYLDLLSESDYMNANAFYVNNKYILFFPQRREALVYDRERGSFAGIWKMPYGINKAMVYVDDSGTEQWVLGSSSSNQVYVFNEALNTDNGEAIQKTLRTNKDAFGQWSIIKIIKLFYSSFKSVSGQVNVSVLAENRDGSTSAIKTFTIEGSAVSGSIGWGSDMWGYADWGTSDGTLVTASEEQLNYSLLFKPIRLVQVEVSTNQSNANFELLNIRMTANSQGEGSLPSSARV